MVEGHQCHRVAAAHRRSLLHRAFKATSPNGRFDAGAAAINNGVLTRIEVHGKNLFYFFSSAAPPTGPRTPAARKRSAGKPARAPTGPPPQPAALQAADVVHIHFGMSGAFKTMKWPGEDATATTRLRLECKEAGLVAHLSAMTVKHGGEDYYKERVRQLGPDPLREDAEPEQLWAVVQKSKKPIGLVLMDQAMVAGLGNIYRAEVLFKARLHPEQPANTLTRPEFDTVWRHSVLCLQRGFVTGSILTVDDADAAALGRPWTRRYVYNHRSCGFCRGRISRWDMAARTVYACLRCQPLRRGAQLTDARAAALADAKGAAEFVSACAADGPETITPAKMTVAQLREVLKANGVRKLPKAKADLIAAVAELPAATGAAMQGRREEDNGASSEASDATEAGTIESLAGLKDEQQGHVASSAMPAPGAPEGLLEAEARSIAPEAIPSMKVAELKAALKTWGVRYPTAARKADLVETLTWTVKLSVRTPAEEDKEDSAGVGPEVHSGEGAAVDSASGAEHGGTQEQHNAEPGTEVNGDTVCVDEAVMPGTQHLPAMASARAAEEEKARAGENRAVEHVALHEEAGQPTGGSNDAQLRQDQRVSGEGEGGSGGGGKQEKLGVAVTRNRRQKRSRQTADFGLEGQRKRVK